MAIYMANDGGIHKSFLLNAAEGLNYIFIFTLIYVCILKNNFCDYLSYVKFLQLIDKIDDKIMMKNVKRDYYYLIITLTSFVFVNPIIWEYYLNIITLDEMPTIYIITDASTVPFYHIMLNLIATFAILIKYRVQYINDRLVHCFNSAKLSNARRYHTLRHVLNLQNDIYEIVTLFNRLFSWPIALYVPTFISDIVYLFNNIFYGTPWDFIGFSTHDGVS